MKAPKPFAAKFTSGQCAVCGKPIEKGASVMWKELGGKRKLICATGECAKSAPTRFCSACGQHLPEGRS